MGDDAPTVDSQAGSARATLWALFAMNLLNYVDRYILQAVIGPVATDLEINDFYAGTIASAFYISYSLCSPLVGWFGDRLPRNVLLAAAVGIWSLATFGTGLAATYHQMILARGLLGLGEATYMVLAPALLADLFPRERRNAAMTIFYLALPLGAAIGFGLGGALNAWVGWRTAFLLVGGPGLVVALLALRLREPVRGGAEGVSEEERARYDALPLSWDLYSGLIRNRSFVFNTLAMAMSAFALGGLQVFTAKYLAPEGEKNDLARASLLLGIVVCLAGLLGTPLGAYLAENARPRVPGSYFWVCGIGMITSAPFITAALLATTDWLVYGAMFFGLTLACFNFGLANTILVNVTSPKVRAGALAVNLLLIHVFGDIPSPILMGWVSDFTQESGIAGSVKQGLFWAEMVTVPALVLSGVFFCLGARWYQADQERVVGIMRSSRENDSGSALV